MWTENDEGHKPCIYSGDDEYDEATYIIKQINHLKTEEYYKYSDFAVLYRMNSQSRAIEDILRRENIPYKIIGGLKFYERKEIKDIIAYLRLIFNTNDNLSLKRIINEPKRGVGKTSLDAIQEVADSNGISMYEVIKNAAQYGLNRVFINTREFIEQIENLIAKKDEIKILTNNVLKNCTVYNYEKNEATTIYNFDKMNSLDKYDIYLSGAVSLISIENTENKTGRELVVFRDSFASSFVPLLVEGYDKITLIDTRYISPKILSQYIEFNDQDILFLYSTSIINNSYTLK